MSAREISASPFSKGRSRDRARVCACSSRRDSSVARQKRGGARLRSLATCSPQECNNYQHFFPSLSEQVSRMSQKEGKSDAAAGGSSDHSGAGSESKQTASPARESADSQSPPVPLSPVARTEPISALAAAATAKCRKHGSKGHVMTKKEMRAEVQRIVKRLPSPLPPEASIPTVPESSDSRSNASSASASASASGPSSDSRLPAKTVAADHKTGSCKALAASRKKEGK